MFLQHVDIGHEQQWVFGVVVGLGEFESVISAAADEVPRWGASL